MNRLKLIAIAIGVGVFIAGWMEWQLKTVAKTQPQRLTAAELAARGPGNNAHVILTNYDLCDNFVYESTRRNGGTWKKVWVPVVPAGQGCGPQIQIIIADTKISGPEQIGMVAGQVQGLVINKISSLGREERRLLSETYPGADFSKVWIVQNGRSTWSPWAVMGMLGGGGFTVLGVLAAWASEAQRR